MFCPQCGNKRSESDKFCAFCGSSFLESNDQSRSESKEITQGATQTISQETKQSISAPVYKSIIDGRMARKEYAIITFVPYLLGVFFAIITDSTGIDEIYYLVVPILALWIIFGYFASIRRLHDMNKSAWWLLLIAFAFLLMVIKQSLELVGVDTNDFDLSILGILFNIAGIAGFVMLLSLIFAKGSKEENRYGKPVVGRGFSLRGTLLNLYSENEKLDNTYFYTAISIFIGIIIILASLWFKI